MNSDWDISECGAVEPALVRQLFDNRIAAIRVPGFISEAACERSVEAITAAGFDYYEDVDPPIGRIGITQFENRDEKSRYLALASLANKARTGIFLGLPDPFEQVWNALRSVWDAPVRLAAEPDGATYFAGLIRLINEALVHCDWAPHDAERWAIGSITGQIAWNVYLSLPAEGGETVVYDAPWTEDAELYKSRENYGYAPKLVDGSRSVRITPRRGELVLFNSRNMHAVAPASGGHRITISSFIGRTAEGGLVLWS